MNSIILRKIIIIFIFILIISAFLFRQRISTQNTTELEASVGNVNQPTKSNNNTEKTTASNPFTNKEQKEQKDSIADLIDIPPIDVDSIYSLIGGEHTWTVDSYRQWMLKRSELEQSGVIKPHIGFVVFNNNYDNIDEALAAKMKAVDDEIKAKLIADIPTSANILAEFDALPDEEQKSIIHMMNNPDILKEVLEGISSLPKDAPYIGTIAGMQYEKTSKTTIEIKEGRKYIGTRDYINLRPIE